MYMYSIYYSTNVIFSTEHSRKLKVYCLQDSGKQISDSRPVYIISYNYN